MRKFINSTIWLSLVMAVSFACQPEQKQIDLTTDHPVFNAQMSAGDPATKTSIDIEGSVGHLDWAEGDMVGVYVAIDNVQKQQNIKFANTSSNLKKFTGTLTQLNESSVGGASYYAYYPYKGTADVRFCFTNLSVPDYVAVGEIPVYQEGDFGTYDFMVSTPSLHANYDETALENGSDVIDIEFPTEYQLFKTLRMVLPRISTFTSHITKTGNTYDVEVSRIKISADQMLTGQFMVDLSNVPPVAVFDTTSVFLPISMGEKNIYAAFENPIVLDDASRGDLVLYFTLRECDSLTNLKVSFETQYGQAEFWVDRLLLDGDIKPLTIPADWRDVADGGKAHWTYPSVDAAYDASMDGTANCYVLRPNTSYKFKVNKKGNGNDYSNPTAGANALSSYSADIDLSSNTLQAVLLWESILANNTDTSVISKNGVSYQDSFIYVTTGSGQGNAVVALIDNPEGKTGNALKTALSKTKNGVVIWSWHIWVTNDADLINAKSCVDPIRKIMLRNLGAYDNTSGVNRPQNRGLLYQWGRKDPFLPSISTSANVEYRNNAVGDGLGTWQSGDLGVDANIVLSNGNTLTYAIEHPMFFFKKTKDWFHPDTVIQNNLWGGGYFIKNLSGSKSSATPTSMANTLTDVTDKTMFDPCPPGYRMPVVGVYGYTSLKPLVRSYVNDIWVYASTSKGAETMGGIFYPITGRREYDNGTYKAFTSINYWFGSVASGISPYNYEEGINKRSYATTTYITSASGYPDGIRVEPSNLAEKGTARPIRCILENFFVPYYDWSGLE